MTEARVLLVESDPQVSALLRRFLARSGHALVEATDGAAALTALEAQPFDVVILRMNLGDGQAAAVLAGARAAAAEPSVILTGSRATADAFARAVDCVGAIFLVKPFGGRDLARALDDGLAQRRIVIDSAPVEALDFESIFDGVEVSVGPGPAAPVSGSSPPLDPFAPPGLAAPRAPSGALLAPPSASPPAAASPQPTWGGPSLEFGSLLGDDPAPSETGDLLGPPDGSRSEASGPPQGGPPASAAPAAWAPRAESTAPAPPGPLPVGEPARRDLAGLGVGGPSPVVEAEAAYLLRPLIGDGQDEPRGTKGELSLSQLLVGCARDLFTGRLTLQRGPARKVFLLAGGQIIDSHSNLEEDELGALLEREGRLSAAGRAALLAFSQSQRLTVEAAAVTQGVVDEAGLEALRARLIRGRVLGCFTWTGAEYGVVEDLRLQDRLQDRPPPLQLDPQRLVVEAALERLPPAPLLDHFDAAAQWLVGRTARFESIRGLRQAFPALDQVGALCDGRSFGAVVAASPLRLTATLRALRALEHLEAIRLGEATAAPAGQSGAALWDRSSSSGEGSLLGGDDGRPGRHPTGEHPSAAGQQRHATGEQRHTTDEHVGYRPPASSERPGPFDDAPASGSLDVARHDSRSLRAVREPGGRRSGIYRATGAATSEPSRAPAAAISRRPSVSNEPSRPPSPLRRVPSGVPSAVRRPTGEQAPVSQSHQPRAGSAAPPASSPARPADIAALKRRLQAKHASLGEVDHYTLLEIAPSATAEEVRAAYQQLSRQMHQAAAHDARLSATATEVGRRLAEAASVLSNRRQRAQYDAVHGARAASPPMERDLEGAEEAFGRGRACLDRGDLPDAYDHFDRASRLAPDRPLHRMFRAYAKFRLSYPKHRKAAVEAHDDLKGALLEDPSQDGGFVLMAHIYRETGNTDMAIKFYRKALSLNRKNREASDGLAQLAPSDEPGEGSLFGRLFKR